MEKSQSNKLITTKINKILDSNISDKNFVYYLSLILLAVQFLGICYFNLFQASSHLGFDASSNMLNARMMWEQKKLLPDNYAYQTALCLGLKNIMAALVYGLVKDICLSFGIVNILITVCIAAIVFSICNAIGMNRAFSVMILNIIFTPFVSPFYNVANPLGYYPSMFVSASFYSVTILQYLIILRIMIGLSKGEKSKTNTALIIISIFLAILGGFSSGYSLFVFLIIPMLLYIIARVIIFSDIKYLIDKTAVFTLVQILSVAAGKLLNSWTVGFESKEASMSLVSLPNFWTNFGNIFLGFAGLLSAGNGYYAITALSSEGIVTLINAALVILFFIGIIYALYVFFKKDLKQRSDILYIISFCFVNFFLYAAINSAYGGGIFEERYLIPFFIFGVFLTAYAAENVLGNFFRNTLLIGSICLISVGTISSFSYMDKGKVDFLREMKSKLSVYDAKVVYGYNVEGSDMHVYARDMRVVDSSKVYKLVSSGGVYHWGDYLYCDDAGDNVDDILIILPSGQYEYLPEYYQKNFNYFDSCGGYELYHSQRNVFDYETGLAEDGYSADIPVSNGVILQNCFINDNGCYQTDGIPGYSLFGPNAQALPGKYRFTLHYNFLEDPNDVSAVFDIGINYGNCILGSDTVSVDKSTATVEVEFTGEETFEYRLWVNEGAKIEIEYIEMEKIA